MDFVEFFMAEMSAFRTKRRGDLTYFYPGEITTSTRQLSSRALKPSFEGARWPLCGKPGKVRLEVSGPPTELVKKF